jgi:fatty-acyl-CoA synthase
MDTQELDRTIKRASRNTIGDAIRRSAARNPQRDAVIFGERRWSYTELDAGVKN